VLDLAEVPGGPLEGRPHHQPAGVDVRRGQVQDQGDPPLPPPRVQGGGCSMPVEGQVRGHPGEWHAPLEANGVGERETEAATR